MTNQRKNETSRKSLVKKFIALFKKRNTKGSKSRARCKDQLNNNQNVNVE